MMKYKIIKKKDQSTIVLCALQGCYLQKLRDLNTISNKINLNKFFYIKKKKKIIIEIKDGILIYIPIKG